MIRNRTAYQHRLAGGRAEDTLIALGDAFALVGNCSTRLALNRLARRRPRLPPPARVRARAGPSLDMHRVLSTDAGVVRDAGSFTFRVMFERTGGGGQSAAV